jgi:3-hydroxyisobutyrate dehydrogenase-like beta-hydroxyacid dehydrogenase
MRTSFIGLGVMGYPMAGYLSRSGQLTIMVGGCDA